MEVDMAEAFKRAYDCERRPHEGLRYDELSIRFNMYLLHCQLTVSETEESEQIRKHQKNEVIKKINVATNSYASVDKHWNLEGWNLLLLVNYSEGHIREIRSSSSFLKWNGSTTCIHHSDVGIASKIDAVHTYEILSSMQSRTFNFLPFTRNYCISKWQEIYRKLHRTESHLYATEFILPQCRRDNGVPVPYSYSILYLLYLF
jgi:hypothetical protein